MEKKRRISRYERKHEVASDLELAKRQRRLKKPVIENSVHLIQHIYRQYYDQELINFYISLVYGIANDTSKHYKKHLIPKRNGKMREINEPDESLKFIQKVLANRFFNKFYDARKFRCANGFVEGRSIKSNALPHVKHDYLLKLDIKDFFPSIKENLVFDRCFGDALYPESVKTLITKLVCLNGSLPQGAPTSPIVSNIVMSSFDSAIVEFCSENNLSYTRYADDLAVSSNKLFDHKKVIQFVKNKLFELNHMSLNMKKIVFAHNGQRKEICGVVVNEKAQVSKAYRDAIRQEMHFINKKGFQDHVNYLYYNKKIDRQYSLKEYAQILLGKVNFVLHIDKDNKEFIAYRKQLEEWTGKKLAPNLDSELEADIRSKLRFYLTRRNELVIDEDLATDYEKIIKHLNNSSEYWYRCKDKEDMTDLCYFLLSYISRNPGAKKHTFEKIEDFLYENINCKNCLPFAYLMILFFEMGKDDNSKTLYSYWVSVGASLGLGRAYLIKSKLEPEKEKMYLEKAALLKDPKAQYQFAHTFPEGSEERKTFILASADNDYVKAYVKAAEIYEEYGLDFFAVNLYKKFYDSFEYIEDIEDNVLLKLIELSKKSGYKLNSYDRKFITQELIYRGLIDK